MSLTLQQITDLNTARANRWHKGFPYDNVDSAGWSLADWSNAMAGEAGEACNVVKKIRRLETGAAPGPDDPPRAVLMDMLADEIADVYLYLDLLATKAGIDVQAALIRKFNRVSERQGFPERLVP